MINSCVNSGNINQSSNLYSKNNSRQNNVSFKQISVIDGLYEGGKILYTDRLNNEITTLGQNKLKMALKSLKDKILQERFNPLNIVSQFFENPSKSKLGKVYYHVTGNGKAVILTEEHAKEYNVLFNNFIKSTKMRPIQNLKKKGNFAEAEKRIAKLYNSFVNQVDRQIIEPSINTAKHFSIQGESTKKSFDVKNIIPKKSHKSPQRTIPQINHKDLLYGPSTNDGKTNFITTNKKDGYLIGSRGIEIDWLNELINLN